jgi:hypothetical protein
MAVLNNRHVITALIVAPVLALIAYFGFDFLAGETPQAAVEGQSYSLVEKPNCRYDSGQCGFKNGDFELTIGAEQIGDGYFRMTLNSVFPLDGIKVSVVASEADDKRPVDMRPESDDGMSWSLEVGPIDPEQSRLRLVASSRGSLYYGDADMKFTTAGTRD